MKKIAALIFGLGLVTTLVVRIPRTFSATVKPKPPIEVFANVVKAGELFDLLSYPARVEAKVNTTILAETDGVVSKVFAPLGQKVPRGASILKIIHTDPVYQYAPMIVKAPVAGVVSQVEVTEGSQVARGQKLASVTDPTQIRVTLEAPALDLPFLFKGLTGNFRVGNQEAFGVRIKGISPFVDPASGTASAELELVPRQSSEKGSARPFPSPGLVGQVSFKANQRKGISIPDHAVFYRGNDSFVRIVVDGKAKKIPVKLGRRQQGQVEIVKGLADNAMLVERASRYVGDGEAVTVQSSNGDKGGS